MLLNPILAKKTVLFVLYEGKDTRNNLYTVLQKHAESLKQLTSLNIK